MTLFACATIAGSEAYNSINGVANFYKSSQPGIFIEIEVYGLPDNNSMIDSGFYGMHIHEKDDCTPPFDNTGAHFNPNNLPHPYHAGDLPPILGNSGYAYLVYYTNRLTENEIIGKSIIIHSNPDDFTTQPSGNSGEKIACGSIKKCN